MSDPTASTPNPTKSPAIPTASTPTPTASPAIPTASTPSPTAPTPIPTTSALAVEPRPRLWPGVVIIVFEWAALKLPSLLVPGSKLQLYGMMFGPMAGLAAFVLWWLFASRLRWVDRLLVLAVCVAAGGAAHLAFDPTFGLMVVFMYALP